MANNVFVFPVFFFPLFSSFLVFLLNILTSLGGFNLPSFSMALVKPSIKEVDSPLVAVSLANLLILGKISLYLSCKNLA